MTSIRSMILISQCTVRCSCTLQNCKLTCVEDVLRAYRVFVLHVISPWWTIHVYQHMRYLLHLSFANLKPRKGASHHFFDMLQNFPHALFDLWCPCTFISSYHFTIIHQFYKLMRMIIIWMYDTQWPLGKFPRNNSFDFRLWDLGFIDKSYRTMNHNLSSLSHQIFYQNLRVITRCMLILIPLWLKWRRRRLGSISWL